jgi:hypothetical protein
MDDLFNYTLNTNKQLDVSKQQLLQRIKSNIPLFLTEYSPISNRGMQFNVNMLRSA